MCGRAVRENASPIFDLTEVVETKDIILHIVMTYDNDINTTTTGQTLLQK